MLETDVKNFLLPKPTPVGLEVKNDNYNNEGSNNEGVRIFCLRSSEADGDPNSKVEWDNGIQGHMYTNENDILIVRLPPEHANSEGMQNIREAVNLNCEIYKKIGINLAGSDNIVFVSEEPGEGMEDEIFRGNMTECLSSLLKEGRGDTVLPMLTKAHKDILEQNNIGEEYINAVQTLQNKNTAMELFANAGIKVPSCYIFDTNNTVEQALNQIDKNDEKLYVLKDSTTAGGENVYVNKGNGYNKEELEILVEKLKLEEKLPITGQIQEFIKGKVGSALVVFEGNNEFSFESIQEQIIKDGNDFIGCEWNSEFEKEYKEQVNKIFNSLKGIDNLLLLGPLGIDFIINENNEVVVIEVNPRVTGATPIPYIKNLFGSKDLDVESIYLDVEIKIPQNFDFLGLVECIKNKYGVHVLPQGINPHGNTKVLFINDSNGEARNYLEEQLNKQQT